ncbi:MAG TPA: alpha/beta fold hydrolase [Bdellovibrionota bacterium]|jgi:hypothetical protein|nr:alpha/beta fold hydrolase [Bdellovibrionota bacterium]
MSAAILKGANEKPVIFGAEKHLIGMVGEPEAATLRPKAPVVILLNAGLLHRAGPYRMTVFLARRLNAAGYRTLRFDLSGIGDSEMRKGKLDDWQRAKIDIREAMDLMAKRTGAERFVLWGFCSGADYSHPQALTDSRIVGAVMMDAYGWRTLSYWIWSFFGRIFNSRKLRNFLARGLRKLIPKAAEEPVKGESYVREFPPKERVQSELQFLIKRGMSFLFLYTSGVPEYFNHAGQFWGMMPKLKQDKTLQVDYYGRTDHTYSLHEDRERLLERITNWMVDRFPA